MLATSEACERNKQPIADELRSILQADQRVLEIGSGTGQHAVFFGTRFPQVIWQPTDRDEYLSVLEARLSIEGTQNIRPARSLDVRDAPWLPGLEERTFDVVYSANTLHIMSWACVEHFFRGVGELFARGGWLIVYGPFLYSDGDTAPSNLAFNRSLRARDPDSGLRRFKDVDALAAAEGLRLAADRPMPANNRLVSWRKDRLLA